MDPRAGAADRRIRELIREANRARSGARPARSKELAARTAELDRLTAAEFREGADQAERMLVQSVPPPGRAEAVARAARAWEEAYWASLPEGEHQVVVDARPSLYSCFDVADLLISDVSSVISDFLASGKPYAVANTGSLSEAEFRAVFPTVAAAAILTPDAAGVPALLETVRHPEKDELAGARAALKARLLGPAEPSSQERFAAAVRALGATALEHRLRAPGRRPAELPGQRRELVPHPVSPAAGPRSGTPTRA